MDPGSASVTPRFNRPNLYAQFQRGGVQLINHRYQSNLVYDNPAIQADASKFTKELDKAAATSLRQELKRTGFESQKIQGTGSTVAPLQYLTAEPVQSPMLTDMYGETPTNAPFPASGAGACGRRGRPPKSASTALVPYTGAAAKKKVVARKSTTRGRTVSRFA